MNSIEGASDLLGQLRIQSQAFGGEAAIDEALARKGIAWYLKQATAPEDLDEEYFNSLKAGMIRSGSITVDDLWDAHFAPIVEQIENTARSLWSIDLDGEHHIAIGHLATGQLNAITMPVPGHSGAYLIALEDGIISFSSFICHIVSCAVPRSMGEHGEVTFNLDTRKVADWVDESPESIDRFAELVARYAVIGNIDGVQIPPLSLGCLYFSEMLTHAIDYFVVGHEYSHIIVGHLDDEAAQKELLPSAEAELFAYSWQQELDADLGGAILAMVATADQIGYVNGFAGIEIFFCMFDVIDRAVSLLQTGGEDERQLGTHPPAGLRRRSLRAILPQLAGGDPRVAEQLELALDVADGFAKLIDILWGRARPFIINLRAQGIPAAQKWHTIPKELWVDSFDSAVVQK